MFLGNGIAKPEEKDNKSTWVYSLTPLGTFAGGAVGALTYSALASSGIFLSTGVKVVIGGTEYVIGKGAKLVGGSLAELAVTTCFRGVSEAATTSINVYSPIISGIIAGAAGIGASYVVSGGEHLVIKAATKIKNTYIDNDISEQDWLIVEDPVDKKKKKIAVVIDEIKQSEESDETVEAVDSSNNIVKMYPI
jgi:hypothetical protein